MHSRAPATILMGFDMSIFARGGGKTLALKGGAIYLEMSAHMQKFINGLTKKKQII